MNVLHVVPSYLPAYRYGGPIVSVHNLCRSQVELGQSVTVCTTSMDGPEDLDVNTDAPVIVDGVNVRYCAVDSVPRGLSRRLYRSRSMADYLDTAVAAADIVHLHSVYLWPTWYAARQARKRGKPYVISPRGMLVADLIRQRNRWVKLAWLHTIEKTNLRNAAAIHFTSERERQDARQFVPEQLAQFIVPNGIQPQLPETTVIRDSDHIIYLGRINWKKGLDRLLKAVAQCADVRLTVAGNDEEGYLAHLQQLVEQLGISNRVAFIGFVDDARKSELLQQASLLALCSDNENFGNVVLEAMAAACPVVVTEGVGAAELVIKHDAGLVVKPESDAIASAIKQLIGDETMRKTLGQHAREAAADCYNWQTIAESMINEYQAVLRNTAKAV